MAKNIVKDVATKVMSGLAGKTFDVLMDKLRRSTGPAVSEKALSELEIKIHEQEFSIKELEDENKQLSEKLDDKNEEIETLKEEIKLMEKKLKLLKGSAVLFVIAIILSLVTKFI